MQFHRIAFVLEKIYTVLEKSPYAEAVVINENKMLYVRSNCDVPAYISPDPKVIDLKGKLMLPGF